MTTQPIIIIGIDCATDESNIGLAHGQYVNQRTTLIELRTASHDQPARSIIQNWLVPGQPTLLALDSPLGWPATLALALSQHRAGQAIPVDAHTLFRRETDRAVRRLVGKQSLEVGADRIARTARAALALLGDLRKALNQPIPLAWDWRIEPDIAAIEVYPAATLLAYGFRQRAYPRQSAALAHAILEMLHTHLSNIDIHTAPSRHAIDAALCVLAANDFLQGYAVPPSNLELAQQEGWIWVRRPDKILK